MDDGETGVKPVRSTACDWSLYPDVARSSTLQVALQAEFDQAGHDLEVLVPESPGWWDVGAVVRGETRSVDIVMASRERAFTMQFWRDGILVAGGSAADLDGVAGSTRLWLGGALVRQLNTAWSFVEFGPFAEACERGEGNEFTWRQFHDYSGRDAQLIALRPFVAAAIHEPRLRALFPTTAMSALVFRSAAGRGSAFLFSVRPRGDDRYVVRGPDGEVGVADAAGCVVLALRVLDAIAPE